MSAHNKRVIDLTNASVKRLKFKGSGLVKVILTKVSKTVAEEFIASYSEDKIENDTSSSAANKAIRKTNKKKALTKKQKSNSTKKAPLSKVKKQATKPIQKKPIKKTVK
jgi:rare lipoprotein A (peptidoglycan hydrolase)